ncbi:hypothetical protein C0W40_15610 [Photobacterium leiognathi subsp. mandapamensis]|nr:hypothetical protein C0W40_15610 [Photobacterium leiognathi subsp. mandapamensis]
MPGFSVNVVIGFVLLFYNKKLANTLQPFCRVLLYFFVTGTESLWLLLVSMPMCLLAIEQVIAFIYPNYYLFEITKMPLVIEAGS